METPLAIAVRDSKNPDELHAHFFRYFQALFRLRPEADVRGANILAHDFPDTLFDDRMIFGVAIAGALMAMLDHQMNLGAKAPFVPITREHFKTLDEIILEQAAIAGGILLTSDLVLRRVLEWERMDERKYARWSKALRKAARVHQRKTAAPITDPFARLVKQEAVEQLRPMWARLREKFAKQRRVPSPKEVEDAFKKEAIGPDAPPFVSNAQNHQWWLRWLEFHRKDLVKIALGYSVEKVFDSYAAFVFGHSSPEYVRKKISSLK
jgi:hypothetical protein